MTHKMNMMYYDSVIGVKIGPQPPYSSSSALASHFRHKDHIHRLHGVHFTDFYKYNLNKNIV